MIKQTVNILKALAEPNRLTMVRLLQEREMCVCELAAVLDVSQSRVSQHLKVLRQADLLNERRDGTRSYFSLNEKIVAGRILAYEKMASTDIADIAELNAEVARMKELDSNEDVQFCKQSGDMHQKYAVTGS